MKILLLSREKDYFALSKDLSLFGDLIVHCEKINPNLTSFDLIVSYCYGPILKEKEIKQLKGPILNLHPSFLPYGRGIYPILWGSALDHPLGSTIHLIENNEIDNGSILIQELLNYDTKLTLSQLHCILTNLSKQLLLKLLAKGFPENSDFKKSKPNKNIAKYTYKNRSQGIQFFELLPYGWNTTIDEVKKIYIKNKDLFI
tara:strand:- start:121 stop:723 length:603 start_codon:yes stop_codon:yes gene_type:complete